MMLKICGIAVITLIITVILGKLNVTLGVFLPQICSIFIFTSAIASLFPIVNFIKELLSTSSVDNDTAKLLFTACSIAILSKIISDLCKECGKETLKSAVEFAANIELLLLAVPLLKELLSLTSGILII